MNRQPLALELRSVDHGSDGVSCGSASREQDVSAGRDPKSCFLRVEAAPDKPPDLSVLLGPGGTSRRSTLQPARGRPSGPHHRHGARQPRFPHSLRAGRAGESLPVGIEGRAGPRVVGRRRGANRSIICSGIREPSGKPGRIYGTDATPSTPPAFQHKSDCRSLS